MKFTECFRYFSFAFLYLAIWSALADQHEDFLYCLSHHSPNGDSITKVIYTPNNSSYSSVLNSTIQNLRFSTADTPKPLVVIIPSKASHVQASVVCSKNHGLQIRTRSGGHDFEGLSYVSDVPFIVLDLSNLRSITIDTANKTAWVESGATLGELYYTIANNSRTLGFPAGNCPTVGVGGHFSGGGYGLLQRKYGLSADNVIDAHLIDANGKFLDRKLMGEDLFWAIRGGGGGNFGIILAWKINLVTVPSTVTIFTLSRIWDQNTTKLINRWQYVAHNLHENLMINILLSKGARRTGEISVSSLFLGKADELLNIVQKAFPELGLVKEDCTEMSWIESVVFAASGVKNGGSLEEVLLSRTPTIRASVKAKIDYVKKPISESGLEGIRERLIRGGVAGVFLIPYGGKMSQISESETPFPHRAGILFHIGYIVMWAEEGVDAAKRHINWSRELYSYMTPFVSKSPRAAYVGYRDLDIGTNNKYGKATSYKQASVWGLKYFGNNFQRLVVVKTKVDPSNFFTHEQSIPSLSLP